MNCQKCNSERIANIQAHHNDAFAISCPKDGVEIDGDYAPYITGICGGDDTDFSVCLDCGQIQGKFPQKIDVP